MKILFLSDNFYPEVNAQATRTYEHCKKWVESGHEITIITCFPNFPQGKVYEGYKNKLYKKEMVDGIKVIRVWSYITANEGFVKRTIDQLSFAFTSFIAGLFVKKYDYIIATSPQFFTAWSGWALSKIKRTPWIFEVRDMWPEGIIFLNRDSRLYKILEKIELGLYRSANKIVTVTKSYKKSIVERSGISPEKVKVIYNGSNNDRFGVVDKNKNLLGELKLEDKFIVGYAGTFGISQSMDFIFTELSKVDNSNIHFVFLGDGSMRSKMLQWVKEFKLTNVTILPPVGKDKIKDYLSIFDIGLVPLKKDDAYLKVIPSKCFELAAMGKPILLGVDGEIRDIAINKYNAGVYFEPENGQDFQDSLQILYKERSNYQKHYSEGLAKMSSDFDRNYLANKMMDFINE